MKLLIFNLSFIKYFHNVSMRESVELGNLNPFIFINFQLHYILGTPFLVQSEIGVNCKAIFFFNFFMIFNLKKNLVFDRTKIFVTNHRTISNQSSENPTSNRIFITLKYLFNVHDIITHLTLC